MRATTILASILAAAALAVSLVATAAADTPVPATATATASATPTPTVAPSATPPVINGVQCKSGTLVNGFLILSRDEPPPECQRQVTAPTAPALLGLPPAAGYQLRYAGPAGGTSFPGDVLAEYVSTTGPLAGTPGAIVISGRQRFDGPPLVQVVDASTVVAADYLPTPGIALPGIVPAVAEWLDGGNWYTIAVDPRLTSLTLEDVARLLTPIAPTTPPAPPTVGSGESASACVHTFPLEWSGVAAAAIGATALLVIRRRTARRR